MPTYTTRLAATKSASSENVDITVLNNDFDLFDLGVGATVGASATRPASAFNGRLFYATDTDKLYVNEGVNASSVASWSDPVAQALAAIGDLSISGALTVGNGLTVSAGKGTKTYARKSASESVASTTTVQSDDHITFTLAASAVYELKVFLTVSGSTGGDFKTQWLFTGAASGGNHTTRYGLGPGTATTTASATAVMQYARQAWTTEIAYGVDGTLSSHIEEGGLLDTTTGGSGTITLQWAQNTSNAASTVVGTGSYAILERLA
jgi:hypothetical protein